MNELEIFVSGKMKITYEYENVVSVNDFICLVAVLPLLLNSILFSAYLNVVYITRMCEKCSLYCYAVLGRLQNI